MLQFTHWIISFCSYLSLWENTYHSQKASSSYITFVCFYVMWRSGLAFLQPCNSQKQLLCSIPLSQLEWLTLLSKTPRFACLFLTWHKQREMETQWVKTWGSISASDLHTSFKRKPPLSLFHSRLKCHLMSKEDPEQPTAFPQMRQSHLTQFPDGAPTRRVSLLQPKCSSCFPILSF